MIRPRSGPKPIALGPKVIKKPLLPSGLQITRFWATEVIL